MASFATPSTLRYLSSFYSGGPAKGDGRSSHRRPRRTQPAAAAAPPPAAAALRVDPLLQLFDWLSSATNFKMPALRSGRSRASKSDVVAVLEKFGKVRGQARSLDTYLAKIYNYCDNAKAVAQAKKSATMRAAIKDALEETAAASASVLGSADPTRRPHVHTIQPGSGAEAALDDAIAQLPQTASVVNSLIEAAPNQARLLGLDSELHIPDLDAPPAQPRPPPALAPGPSPTPAPEPEPIAAVQPEAGSKDETKKKKKEKKEGAEPEVGAYHARLCEETPCEYRIGNKNAREMAAKSEVCKVVGERAKDPSKFCPFNLLSKGKYPHACCGSAGQPGHKHANDTAHRYSKSERRQAIGLLVAMAATSEGAIVPPPSPSWFSAGATWSGPAPSISPALFDAAGGTILVPLRYGSGGAPEIGVPSNATGHPHMIQLGQHTTLI